MYSYILLSYTKDSRDVAIYLNFFSYAYNLELIPDLHWEVLIILFFFFNICIIFLTWLSQSLFNQFPID